MRPWLFITLAIFAMVFGMFVYQSQQYDFKTVDGQTYKWEHLNNQWVVVNYFAEWCAPCLKEVPELNDFNEWASEVPEVSLFAISYDPLSQEQLSSIKKKYKMQFSLVIPESQSSMPLDKPQYLPATFIIAPNGKVSKPLLGEQTFDSLRQAVLQYRRLNER